MSKSIRQLYFKNNSFKIVQLTDLHLLFPKILYSDFKTYSFIEQLLMVEKPDLVVVTGDVTLSLFNFSAIKHFFNFLDKFGIPWAFTFGNHDGQFGRSKRYIAKRMSGFQNSCFEVGPSNIKGSSNYYVDLIDAKHNIKYALYFMDSLIERKHLSDSQIDWFKETSNKHHQGIDKLMFFHIPLKEFKDARNDGIISGDHRETISTPKDSSRAFNTFKENGVKAIFVGHDHTNDFTARYEGVLLAYGRSSGFTGYGGKKALKGARIIEIEEGGEIKTWIIEAHWLAYHFPKFKMPEVFSVILER
ncbi:MAG TPA: metallophosphoesterase family protein [Acholeplasmataceae bacterium]|nr:metallophosphoesterase family protein [Acholeplasmataceae bacterium]